MSRRTFEVASYGHRLLMNAAAREAALDTVILDLDGTLVDTVYQHVLAWRSAFLSVGVDIPAWRIHRAIGIGGDRLVAELAGRGSRMRSATRCGSCTGCVSRTCCRT